MGPEVANNERIKPEGRRPEPPTAPKQPAHTPLHRSSSTILFLIMSIANKSFLALLRNYDIVRMVTEVNAAGTCQETLKLNGRCHSKCPDLLALQLLCKDAFEAMAWCRYNRRCSDQPQNQKKIAEYILTGGNMEYAFPVPEYNEQRPLCLPVSLTLFTGGCMITELRMFIRSTLDYSRSRGASSGASSSPGSTSHPSASSNGAKYPPRTCP
jgi:hypothetical protein